MDLGSLRRVAGEQRSKRPMLEGSACSAIEAAEPYNMHI
jgi:hypothetical protein